MGWLPYDDVRSYIEDHEDSLLQEESMNNLILGRLGRLAKRPEPTSRLLALIQNGSSVGHAIQTSPDDALLLSRMAESAVDSLIEHLIAEGKPLSQVHGPHETCRFFSDRWSTHSGRVAQVRMEQGVYELRAVNPIDPEGGGLVVATDAHRTLARPLLEAFVKECFPEEREPGQVVDKRLERFIQEQRLFLWEDAHRHIVAVTANHRETRNTACLSWVYTPPEFRGRGYASRVVSCASQTMLNRGFAACNLFTDLENETSNAMYLRLGYRVVGRALRVEFKPPPV